MKLSNVALSSGHRDEFRESSMLNVQCYYLVEIEITFRANSNELGCFRKSGNIDRYVPGLSSYVKTVFLNTYASYEIQMASQFIE